MGLPTELQCEATIIEAAKLFGWMCHGERTAQNAKGNYRTAIKGDRGYPDLTLVRGHRLLFVELKRDKTGRMGPGQQEWLDALHLVVGVNAMVVWVPSEMSRLIELLR